MKNKIDHEKLIDLIEGWLDPEEEAGVLKEISENPTLRSEYTELNRLMQNIDKEQYFTKVPPQVTETIFEEVNTVSSIVATSFLSKMSIKIGSMFSGMVIVGIISFVIMKNGHKDNIEDTTSSENQQTYECPGTIQNGGAAFKNIEEKNVNFVKPILDTEDTEKNLSENQTPVVSTLTKVESSAFVPEILNKHNSVILLDITEQKVDSHFETISVKDTRFYINFGRHFAQHLANVNIEPKEYSELNNYSIELGYKISDHASVAINYSQETFYQKYEGIDELGFGKIYEQQPNVSTISGKFTYELFSMGNSGGKFSAGLFASVGVNQLGSVGRLGFVSKTALFDNFYFSAGMEYSIMGYSYQSEFFNSQKYSYSLGFRYGLW